MTDLQKKILQTQYACDRNLTVLLLRSLCLEVEKQHGLLYSRLVEFEYFDFCNGTTIEARNKAILALEHNAILRIWGENFPKIEGYPICKGVTVSQKGWSLFLQDKRKLGY